MQALFPFLLLSYPLVLHFSVSSGSIDRAIIYLSLLLSIPFLSALIRLKHPGLWSLFSLLLAIILLISATGHERVIVKFIPLLVNGSLLWIFASTLYGGRVPLVTRFASIMRKDMPPAVTIYTRRATYAWVIYFLTMFVISMFLAIYATIETWSFFSNVISYVFLVLMFLGEYIVRRILVHEYMDYSFLEFIQRLRNVDFSRVFRQ